MTENPAFLREQIITYLGNKRALLPFIVEAATDVQAELGGRKLSLCDPFSGSGIVARALRPLAAEMTVSDLERYCHTLNRCYLSCSGERGGLDLESHYAALTAALEGPLQAGVIASHYAPRDEAAIEAGERVFYTPRNARYLDTARALIARLPEAMQPFFLAPLLYEASVKANTAGVFKGFYKNPQTGLGQYGGGGRNALSRICAPMALPFPVFSAFDCPTTVLRQDAHVLAEQLDETDLVYLDPPYNQHPYGSNYFMLNLINDGAVPGPMSAVSGIPKGWNRSRYNRRAEAQDALLALCRALPARYVMISLNDEGFISRESLEPALRQLGRLDIRQQRHNAFRGSRNLRERAIHTTEYLYILKKT